MDVSNWITVVSIGVALLGSAITNAITIWLSGRKRHLENVDRLTRVEATVSDLKTDLTDKETASSKRLDHLDKCLDDTKAVINDLTKVVAGLAATAKSNGDLVDKIIDKLFSNVTITSRAKREGE